ncbi:roadblock/LC7 domain-containing protein [Streptomyces sp. NPDC006879]|uniref:roadblock/LC7 domain-containing protein n=1 Tax=Streptomyces sp. NPDC006879 TaxID=3364767 RepID=UPI0036BA64E8
MTIKSDELSTEMRALRDRVVGITDVVVASADGLLITAEADDTVDGECLAALAAASLSIARRAGTATGKGPVGHTVARFSDGYMVTQAVGDMALMAVLGDSGMDLKRFHAESQASADRIGLLLTAAAGSTQIG